MAHDDTQSKSSICGLRGHTIPLHHMHTSAAALERQQCKNSKHLTAAMSLQRLQSQSSKLHSVKTRPALSQVHGTLCPRRLHAAAQQHHTPQRSCTTRAARRTGLDTRVGHRTYWTRVSRVVQLCATARRDIMQYGLPGACCPPPQHWCAAAAQPPLPAWQAGTLQPQRRQPAWQSLRCPVPAPPHPPGAALVDRWHSKAAPPNQCSACHIAHAMTQLEALKLCISHTSF